MKVVLVYDEPISLETAGSLPDDIGAEYESNRTIAAMLQAIRACGHESAGLSLAEDFPEQIRRMDPDLVFNIAEGVRGPARESIVPAWLDHLGIPYTGSDGSTLAVSLDKALTKMLVSADGVRTPEFLRIRCLADLDTLNLRLPLFAKPNAEGSSMGIRCSSRVETREELQRQVAWILQTYQQDCLVEEFAPGREFCVGILGNDDPRVFPIVEICTAGDFYTHEEKHEHQRQLICPVEIPETVADEMCQSGLKVFERLSCRDLARIDFKLDSDGQPSFLEINPLPGLSPYHGIFVRQAAAEGLAHEDLIAQIINCALERAHGRRERYSPGMAMSKEKS